MSAATQEDLAKLLLRVSIAALLLLHGIQKLSHGVSGIQILLISKGLPHYLAWGVYISEVLAPFLLLLGLYTRLGGLLISFSMTVAIWLAHSHELYRLNSTGGWQLELQALFLCGGLCIALLGAGRFSIGGPGGRWN